MPKEIPTCADVLQVITDVIPALAEGNHTLARALGEAARSKDSRDLQFSRRGYPSDLLAVTGFEKYLGYIDIRLFNSTDGSTQLFLKFKPTDLNHDLFFAYYGGAVNANSPRLYGNLQDVVDFEFNLENQKFGIRSVGKGQFQNVYPFGQQEPVIFQPRRNSLWQPKNVQFSGFEVGNNIAGLTIGWVDQGPSVSITLPATVGRIDLNALSV
ncbi:hypothetical protein A3E73_01930 [Candidatus Beckwithbacteria bacterium RIFCSPHIGHO2_12_FULL_47_17]|uniref:Uncharacterized protein n=1 Tax=Candidatus Beckwithbacteria bacterium RIFCSPHIGHO2_12_FULL_47_17 TaxID=1797460 RepID=A0A1F5DLY8_9BACT|nr:MAG: hypothetical protein A3E73_01930 [Candidatus Beckwithbacteria bacterium RIFCSPHIGHO2_12_FULL_47_17]